MSTTPERETLLGREQRLIKSTASSVSGVKASGNCTRCGRKLTDPVSVARSMGPICWGRSMGDVFEKDMEASEQEWARREETLRMGGEIDLGCNWRYMDRDPEMALQLPSSLRVSLRFKDGRFEAYGLVYGWGENREVVFGSSEDVRTAYRVAVNAGPQSSATARRIMESNRRAALRSRLQKEVLVS